MSHEEPIIIENSHTVEPRKSNIFVRGAIIVAVILILLFIALAIVKFVPKIISSIGTANVSFSSLFSSKNISVTAPNEVKTGNAFSVGWKNNTGDTDGTLMWSYACVDGVTIEYNSISGQRPVICDSQFPLPTTGESYSFVAKNINKTDTPITMTVALWDKDIKNIKAQGVATMTILTQGGGTPTTGYNPDYNNTATSTAPNTNTTPTKPVTTTNTPSTNYPVQQTGNPDIQVSLLSIGRTLSDGTYQQTTSFAENDRVTVRFNVANIGTRRSGNWNLRADLPTKTQSDRVYVSNNQPALNPGDSYAMTISFDTFDPNARNIVITISANDINQSNNVLNIPVSSNGNTNNNSNNSNNNYNSTGSRADLTVRIIDVGTMGYNNQFYYSNSLNRNDKVAIKFEIQNIGDTYSGTFRFTADLPTDNNDTYNSGSQSSLAPGETRQYIIGFDNPDTGTNTVSIDVDSDNNVRENNENNNDDSRSIRVYN